MKHKLKISQVLQKSGTKNKKTEVKNEDGTASFEDAISATGFGKFNVIFLTVIAIPSAWVNMTGSTSTAFILPMAQCDLELSLTDKGLLSAALYTGMIITGFFIGVISDTFGRKKVLIFGYLFDALFVILAGCSQSFGILLLAKVLDGCVVSGPFSAITSVLSEFHAAKYRAKILLYLGLLYTSTSIFLALLAWLVLPLEIDFKLFNGYLAIHSWNLFLFLTAIPIITSCIIHIFVPESPKYLMTAGRNDEALDVFKKIYHWNTGNDPDTFPIKRLVEEEVFKRSSEHSSKWSVLQFYLKKMWVQMKSMFLPPHGVRLLSVCCIDFGVLMGINVIRLWLPQIFTNINDYEKQNNGRDSNFCDMLMGNKSTTIDCTVNTSNDSVYINSIISYSCTIVAYLVAGSLVNLIGKKMVMFAFGIPSGFLYFGLYFAQNAMSAIVIAILLSCLQTVVGTTLITIVVDLFPTTQRTSAISLTNMAGRLGSLLGNVIYPILLGIGCLPPFAALGGIFLTSVAITALLPKTDLKALQ